MDDYFSLIGFWAAFAGGCWIARNQPPWIRERLVKLFRR